MDSDNHIVFVMLIVVAAAGTLIFGIEMGKQGFTKRYDCAESQVIDGQAQCITYRMRSQP